jgi:hypothetical protein
MSGAGYEQETKQKKRVSDTLLKKYYLKYQKED